MTCYLLHLLTSPKRPDRFSSREAVIIDEPAYRFWNGREGHVVRTISDGRTVLVNVLIDLPGGCTSVWLLESQLVSLEALNREGVCDDAFN
jgi:hypothetical protein